MTDSAWYLLLQQHYPYATKKWEARRANFMKNCVLLLIVFSVSACLKSAEPGLPEASQVGSDTFGCLVDGQLWLPNNYNAIFWGSVAHEAYYSRGTHQILITAQQYTKENGLNGFSFLFDASIPNQLSPVLTQYIGGPPMGLYYDKNDYYSPQINSLDLYVSRFDTLNQIVSGTFSMHLLGQCTHRPVTITKGVFDLKLKVQ